MHLSSKFHPMQGNPDSGVREIFACGIQNLESWDVECGIKLKESRTVLDSLYMGLGFSFLVAASFD